MHIGNEKIQINACIFLFIILLSLVILQVGPNVVLTSSKQDENLHQILTSCKQLINTLLYSACVHVLIYMYIVNIQYINTLCECIF